MSDNITVRNIGPVHQTLVIPVQPGGTVIRGGCGVGKSQTLLAISLALGGDGKVSPTRGEKKGEVDCLGVRLSVGASRTTRTGEPDCTCLEEFSLEDLIYPPRKGEDEKQRYGISALLRITGAKADPALFYELAGGKDAFDKLITPAQAKTDDLVELAGRVKRAFDARARDAVAEAEREEGKAAALRNAGDGLDLNIATDAANLQAALEVAAGTKSALDEQAKAATQAKSRAESARRSLAQANLPTPETILGAENRLSIARNARETASNDVSLLEAQLRNAKNTLALAEKEEEAAAEALGALEKTAEAGKGWNDAIADAADVWEPSPEDMTNAAAMVQQARTAIETAAIVREAKRKVEEAKQHQEAASEHRRVAMQASENAKGTWEVLSTCVNSKRFSVVDGVLLGTLPDGQTKPYYGDMSDGERAMVAIAEKIEKTRGTEPDSKRLAIVDIGQRIFQDIPDSVRAALFRMSAEMFACLIAGQVDDGPLRAEVYEP
jgi:hypothetical protein